MKKILAVLLVVAVICTSLVFASITVDAGTVIESAISWAVAIANDDSHGYSQTSRFGPDYDCSSLVISAFKNAGVSTGDASYTGNMISNFEANGFTWIPWSSIGSSSNLQRGDILLNIKYHTAIYMGNNQVVEAHARSAADKAYDNRDVSKAKTLQGDQDGQEIRVTNYYWYSSGGWDGVLRYKEEAVPISHNPTGYFDWVTSDNPAEIHLHGWAFDRDDVSANLLLHIYVNDKHYASITADESRPDVNEAYPGVGDNHGFDERLIVNKSGNLNIKVYAINIGEGSNILLENGEKTVSVSADPTTPKRMKTCTLDGHEYRLYACSTTWENAKAVCEEKGGYLATITSAREQRVLYELLGEYSPTNFFLGAESKSGSWNWVTGEPFSYTAWAENQPDNANNAEFYLGAYKHSRTDNNLKFWNDFTNNYSDITGFIFESGEIEENIVAPSDNPPTVIYSGYIGDSWTGNASNGEIIGTENQNRFKAVKIGLTNCTGGIKYSAHFANTGWSDYVQDNDICGSESNEMSSIEAIKMELYGDAANLYNIWYSVYVRDKGWLGWADNGAAAGSTGGSLPITAIKIMLVPQIRYSAHVRNKGWMDSVKDREISGTTGEELRIEAIKISLNDTAYGNIRYKTHVADLNWGNSVYNGKQSGTTNLRLQTEALQVMLDGKAEEMFDVMYQAHVQDKNWMAWVRNGETAGTTGESLRLEAFKAMVVPKGYTDADSYKEYTSERFTVTFNPMGGTCDVKTKSVSYCGFFKDLPTPTKEDGIFAGWYDSEDFDNKITSSSTLETKANMTLYAKWVTKEEPIYLGDADGDKNVTIIDATQIQKKLAQLPVSASFNEKAARVDGADRLNVLHATYIQRWLASIPVPYPIGETV